MSIVSLGRNGRVTVGNLKEILNKYSDDFTVSICGESSPALYFDDRTGTLVIDDEQFLYSAYRNQ